MKYFKWFFMFRYYFLTFKWISILSQIWLDLAQIISQLKHEVALEICFMCIATCFLKYFKWFLCKNICSLWSASMFARSGPDPSVAGSDLARPCRNKPRSGPDHMASWVLSGNILQPIRGPHSPVMKWNEMKIYYLIQYKYMRYKFRKEREFTKEYELEKNVWKCWGRQL